MQPLNRTAMAKKYAGKWIALRSNRKTVIASGGSIDQVQKMAQKKGVKNPVITRMPKELRSFVGGYRKRAG